MKNLRKIAAVVLVILMVISLAACGRVPASTQKEWSYKANGREYSIGVYVYSLYQAYSQAYQIISEKQGEEFDKEASILDFESSFDETGEVMPCREWIVSEADLIIKDLITIDSLMDKYGITLSEEEEEIAYNSAYSDWNLGPDYETYVSYGYGTTPYKSVLEPIGVSFESFYECTYLLDAKWEALFDYTYGEGGDKAVSKAELEKYFEKEYISYSYFTTELYSTETDGNTGENIYTAYTDERVKEIKDELNLYSKMMAQGTDYESIIGAYMGFVHIPSDPTVSKTENVRSSSLGEDVLEAFKGMKDNSTKVITIGEGENAVAYFLYKKPISDETESYIGNETNYDNLMWEFKGEEFADYVLELTKKTECEINTEAVGKFTPDIIENK